MVLCLPDHSIRRAASLIQVPRYSDNNSSVLCSTAVCIHAVGRDDIGVSEIGTLAAARVIVRGGDADALVTVSMYARVDETASANPQFLRRCVQRISRVSQDNTAVCIPKFLIDTQCRDVRGRHLW